MRSCVTVVGLVLLSCAAALAEPATINGRVVDGSNKPVSNATVLIYEAGVKRGYSTYCPSCCADCGKRTHTSADGSFNFTGLAPDLFFRLLVVHDGYTAKLIDRTDPANAAPVTAVLDTRTPIDDVSRVARGVVKNPDGEPLADVVIRPMGVDQDDSSAYGTLPGLDLITVTNSRGEFEVAYSNKAKGIMVWVEARGMATKLVPLSTGEARTAITVSPGATIRGRLVSNGKPIPNAEVGLIGQERGGYGFHFRIIGNPYEEVRIGTQEDGSFVINNVPAPVKWFVYGKMDSLEKLGASPLVDCATSKDGEMINVGDIQVHPGQSVRGTVTLSDGAPMGGGMHITISSTKAFDSQTVALGSDGSFEFRNVPVGDYTLIPSVRGYQLPGEKMTADAKVDGELSDLKLVLDHK